MSKDIALSELLNKNMEQAAALSTLIYCVGKAAMYAESEKDHNAAGLAMLVLEDIAGDIYKELEQGMYMAQEIEEKPEEREGNVNE